MRSDDLCHATGSFVFMADSIMVSQRTTMNPNMWWFVAAGGVALLVLAQIIFFFSHFDSIQEKDKASSVFALLGFILFVVALALMAALQTAWSFGARAAMLLGAGFFCISTAAGVTHLL